MITWIARVVRSLPVALLLLGCGGDDDGEGAECLGTGFDCGVVCANLETLCLTCEEPPADGCEDDNCMEGCQNVKSDPEAIPEEFRPFVLGELNCLDQNDTCEGFTDCLQVCLGDGS